MWTLNKTPYQEAPLSAMTLYSFIKLLHIFAAILAIGFNLSYTVWMVKGKLENQHLLFALRGIKVMDDWIANPSYIVSLITGLLMCYLGHYNILQTSWIFYPLILFALMGIIAFGFYSPALAQQIKILEEKGNQHEAYQKADKKQTFLGIILFILALLILAIMVLKPDLSF